MHKLIIIRPLGLLYGSAGRFLSPENLVGRSGVSFPPSAATLSGLFAYEFQNEKEKLDNLQLAGPFWAEDSDPENFYVPTPQHCLVKDNHIEYLMAWHKNEPKNGEKKDLKERWLTYRQDEKEKDNDTKNENEWKWREPPVDKFQSNTWIAISDWHKVQNPHQTNQDKPEVQTAPWKFLPHLHPRLKDDERRVDEEKGQGSLFLENAVQLDPDTCLIYLSNTEIPNGWYRFGGEGHMVDIECRDIGETAKTLLNQPLENSFALITPAIWGSNRLSYRTPIKDPNNTQEELSWYGNPVDALLTKQPIPMRHRLGKRKREDGKPVSSSSPGLLSRGRYAVVSGSVYVLKEALGKAWKDWDEEWFPKEGYSFKRWGCGLALPL